ncbi:hypothetical protein D3C72_1862910 [compost metagenome]
MLELFGQQRQTRIHAASELGAQTSIGAHQQFELEQHRMRVLLIEQQEVEHRNQLGHRQVA